MSKSNSFFSQRLKVLLVFIFSIMASYAQQFNTVIGDSPDPFLTYEEGYYYLTGTYGGAVGARRAKTLEGLRSAKAHIFYGPAQGGPPGDYWASEIFRINGKWYIYYTADPTTKDGTDQQRMYVIENSAEDPFTGTWENHRIFDPLNDVWAIDATVFEHKGSLFYVWSGSDVIDDIPHKPQNIYIAKMSNPWTLETERVLLSEPTASWEADQVNEGPEVIKHGNRVFIAYSTFGCWTPDYRLGMIYMNSDSDPLDPASWVKHDAPVFQGNSEVGIYGPGHHCFFKSPDGTEDWFAYHAVAVPEGGCNDKRSVRVQRLYWTSDNLPVFGQPIRQGERQIVPSGEVALAETSPLQNGVYEMKLKRSTNLSLDLDNCNLDLGTNVKVWTDTDNPCQRWVFNATDDGYYTISSYESGLVLDVNNCSPDENVNISVWKPNGSHCQQWKVTESESGFYTLKSRSSGKVIQVLGGTSPGGNVVQGLFKEGDNQKWSLERVDDDKLKDGIYTISSVKSNLGLQLENCNSETGTGIVQNTLSNEQCQQWKITSTGDGFYVITSLESGKALEVPSCSANPTQPITTGDLNDSDCQKFRIIPLGVNGAFKILSKATSMSLDVAGCSSAEGAAIAQYPYWGADCQLWDFNLISDENSSVITEGKARFQVLTPTLIKMEYAGDGIFEDQKTFTVTNLDLPIPAFSTTVVDGWREIQTEQLTLRYKQNSGAFDDTNLKVLLKLNGQTVESKPWTSDFSAQKQEAEEMNLIGSASIATNHEGFSGSGFVAGLEQEGAGMSWQAEQLPEGKYMLAIKYGNGTGGDGQHTTRTMSFYVDGVKTQIALPATADWDTWGLLQQPISLPKGAPLMKFVADAGDTHNINVDYISLHPIADFNEVYEAENAVLEGPASINTDHSGYTGSGFIGGISSEGAAMNYHFDNTQSSGEYIVSIRYANGSGGDGMHTTRTLSLSIDDVKTELSLPKTANWDDWEIVQKKVSLTNGPHHIKLLYDDGDSGNVNIDWLAVSLEGESIPDADTAGEANLGGGLRSLDIKSGEVPLWDGIMSREGWYLLDDSKTALMGDDGWPATRPQHQGGYQNGYFFGYGTNYQKALEDFYDLTGTPPLLPRWAFGVWYSKYEPYSSSYYKETLLPKFRAEKMPLDVLVIDTDWKSPNQWNGWNWNSELFPNPEEFLDWTEDEGLKISLNIHATIQRDDPKFGQTNASAGGLIDENNDGRYHFDYSNKNHSKAYFDLHRPFSEQGVDFWWPDWVDEYVDLEVEGLPTETWLSHLYANDRAERGLRPFSFARIGDGYKGYGKSGPPDMAWSDHRYTLHFTGDTFDDWELLEFESKFTIREANLGIPYVSHDMGSFKGRTLSDDKYIRWLQFGIFQPIFRLHSDDHDDSYRLPWQYPEVEEQAKKFIRLRHALVPYTYSLAHEASTGGMPIVRGMYFYYPEASESYTYEKQYFFGENILISPITKPGEVASTEVWFPEGDWINFFTDKKITGPTVKTVSADYNAMAAFVKAGGIIPLKPYSDYLGQKPLDTLQIKLYAGADGEFIMYEDAGTGLAFKNGAYATTRITYNNANKELTIPAQLGNFTGNVTARTYDIEVHNILPEAIRLNGKELSQIEAASGEGWWLKQGIVNIHLNERSVNEETRITMKEATASIDDLKKGVGVKLFPNPSEAAFNVVLDEPVNEINLFIYDLNGRNVFEQAYKNKSRMLVDTSTFSKGVYIVQIKADSKVFYEKLMVE
ncbi:MAG: hypothetical protein CMF33_09455 [Leeuwenhoekiella sp.]|nr:hypothetical protein [Leeuwenhoekiella sp.]